MNRIQRARALDLRTRPQGETVIDRETGESVQLPAGLLASTYHLRRSKGYSVKESLAPGRIQRPRPRAWQPGMLSKRGLSEDQLRVRGEGKG